MVELLLAKQKVVGSIPILRSNSNMRLKMLNTLVILVLIAAVLWVLWTIYQNGWDLKKAGAAIVAAGAAWWLWAHDSITSLTSGM